ncbi:unnamed protein product [Arctia plantaginis]|uniref:Uncharacterized protein n=1 Tax=Arctia plantaginis TaxID=874455 RepID=A0A8S1BJW0_ARCPL|nr:unnamed protein product [Arctia plantaginis]
MELRGSSASDTYKLLQIKANVTYLFNGYKMLIAGLSMTFAYVTEEKRDTMGQYGVELRKDRGSVWCSVELGLD